MAKPAPRPGHAWKFRHSRDRLLDLPDVPEGDVGTFTARLAGVLGDALRAGVWRQGERLPPATAIAYRFRTSPGTVRQAFVRLAADGLVTRADHGVFVRGVVRS